MNIGVGDHVLVLGRDAGTRIERAAEPAGDARALAKALRTGRPPEPAPTDVVIDDAEKLTERVEKGVELAQQLADGVSPADLESWLEPALRMIEQLDKEGRCKDALKLARTTQRVLALARRWYELVKLLLGLLKSGDDETVAWARHELGTLSLAARRWREADAHLEKALSLRRDAAGIVATKQTLRVLCGDLREQLRRPPRKPRRALIALLALVLFLVGTATGLALGPNDPLVRLAVNVAGEGRAAAATLGIDCPGTCSATAKPHAQVTVVPAADPGSVFTRWAGACSESGPCVVSLDGDRKVTAHFRKVKETRTLRAKVEGNGHVSSRPAGIECPSACSTRVPRGDRVVLTARADRGAAFAGWSGGDCSGTSPCTVSLDESRTVTARFTDLRVEHTLDVQRTGDGSGTVTSEPAGIDCGGTCEATLAAGTQVTLRAVAEGGSHFDGWTGDCSGTDACVVALDAARTVTARFSKGTDTHRLTVERTGDGSGTVTSDPAGIDCGDTCAAPFDSGTQIRLRAVAAEGSEFVGWNGAGCEGAASCSVTLSESKATTASFAKPAPKRFTLKATAEGVGKGEILVRPSCTGTPCAYDPGTRVLLIAQPTDRSSFFDTWRDCPDPVRDRCRVVMDRDRDIGASFDVLG